MTEHYTPLGGPFQTVYLTPAQARFIGLSIIETADHQEGK